MMPTYKCINSYPFQRNQMVLPYNYQPGMEAVPPQMNGDPITKSPLAHGGPWPYAGSYGYSTPMQFCGGHHEYPGYCSHRLAYPHSLASPHMYFAGGNPAYVEPFYVPYAPPPHYSMELPRYEYEKYMPWKHHCCGCPNFPSNHKEGKSEKIEEHEPDVKKINSALNPVQLKNNPYPFVWIPPEYIGKGEQLKPVATATSHKEGGQGVKVEDHEDGEKVNNAVDLVQLKNCPYSFVWIPPENMGDQDKLSHDRKSPKREFPFPIIWIPNYNMQESGRTDNQESTSTPKAIPKGPDALKSPVNSRVGDDDILNRINGNGSDLSKGSSDVTREVENEGVPVKQIELHQGKDDLEGSDRGVKEISVKQAEANIINKESQSSGKCQHTSTDENMTNRESQTGVNRQSTSPQKSSKLPPVCLRVDPLPRKKNEKGSSRSPSPPASKEHSPQADVKLQNASHVKPKEKSTRVVERPSEKKDEGQSKRSCEHDIVEENLKLSNASGITKEGPKEKSNRVLEKSSEKKDTQSQVTSNMASEDHENRNSSASTKSKENLTIGEDCRIVKKEAGIEVNNMKEEEPTEAKGASKVSTKQTDGGSRNEKKVVSDLEAAVLIQAAYRGFQVRKWEPLKKLKQLAEVKKRMSDIKCSIEALETSSDFQNNEKQRVTLGEDIMRLLLKLDTIQGLHPNVRDMRKSLARELTSFQERLDFIMAKKSQPQMEGSAWKPIDNIHLALIEKSMQEKPEEEVAKPGKENTAEEEKLQSVVHSSAVDSAENEEIVALSNEVVDASSKSEVSETEMEAWKELPQGNIYEEECSNDYTEKMHNEEVQHSVVKTRLEDINLPEMMNESPGIIELAELPVGLLVDDTTETGLAKEVQQVREGEFKANVKETSSENDISVETQLDQQQLEEQEEKQFQSTKESNGWLKDELNGEAEENEQQYVTTEITKSNGGALDIEKMLLTEISTPKEEVEKGEIEKEEVQLVNEAQSKRQEIDVVAKQKDEQVMISPASKDMSIPKHDGEENLIEENQKLRQMMQKLLEAGNEQLTVVSNLSEKVRDLEKKLFRKKRIRTKHCKSATCKPSRKKSSNNRLGGRVVDVAM